MSFKTVNDYLNKLSKKDIEILKAILESKNTDQPETYDSVLIKGIKHNQRIIDKQKEESDADIEYLKTNL